MLTLRSLDYRYWARAWSSDFAPEEDVTALVAGFNQPVFTTEAALEAHRCILAQTMLAITGAIEEF